MQPFQQRVINEKAELDTNIFALDAFTKSERFPSLPEAEQLRMIRQLAVMQEYSSILGERIDAFPKCEGGACHL